MRELTKLEGARADVHDTFFKANFVRTHSVRLARKGDEPLLDRARGSLRRHAVQVGTGRGGGRGRVRHLARIGCSDADGRKRQPELRGHHLRDLDMHALPHLGSAVIEQHRSVGIHLDERASLVECGGRERDAELDGRERKPALDYCVVRVPLCNGMAALTIGAAGLELARDERQNVVVDDLPVVRDISFADAIEIGATDIEWIEPQRARNVIDHLLDDHHRLGRAEPAKRGVRNRVRLAPVRDDFDVFEKIGVVDVAKRPVVHGTGKIRRVATT